MKRKSIIIISIISALLISSSLLWRFFPVKVLQDIDSEMITSIKVVNSSNGNQFEITDQDDISKFISSIQKVIFKKKEVASVPGPWYQLDFMNKNEEVVSSLEIQNYRSVRYKFFLDNAIFLYSDEEMNEICDYLQQIEAIHFPDYNKDPDFPYDEAGK